MYGRHRSDSPEMSGTMPGPPSYSESVAGDVAGSSSRMERVPLPEGVPFPELTSKDIVIAVMGITGVGKSTFISYFSPTAVIGASLESCTVNVSIHEAYVGDHKCYLIDTPGFDDTHRSDTDVLREIADWLNRSYQANIQLAGIVYLQRITDPRVAGSSLKNLRMFRKLCGEKGLACVVLATTMWSEVDPERGERREEELISNEEFWGKMVKKGSKVFRQDRDEVSATEILEYILSQHRRIVLDIQEEMASGKTLDNTSAGRELEAELARLKAEHDREIQELRHEMWEAQKSHDKRAQEEIAAVRAEVQEKMRKDQEDRERMRVSMEELQKQRNDEIREERQKNHEAALKHKEALFQTEQRLKVLEIESEYKVRFAEMKAQNEMRNAEIARWEAADAERRRKEAECSVM